MNFLHFPKFLEGLRLDGYNEELKLAWEYQGCQHYHQNAMFHKQRRIDLNSQRMRDQKNENYECNKV